MLLWCLIFISPGTIYKLTPFVYTVIRIRS
jgi:hypothetical protein